MIAASSTKLLEFANGKKFTTVLANPPWRFENKTGKVAPEYRQFPRHGTMELQEILHLPISDIAKPDAHLYLWVPNALLHEGLQVMENWGFSYKTSLVWYKIRRDGGPDRRGVGFYFQNVTELMFFGTFNNNGRTLQPARTTPNLISARRREHSRKPEEVYNLIEACSPGPYLELFARFRRPGWFQWGNEHEAHYDRE